MVPSDRAVIIRMISDKESDIIPIIEAARNRGWNVGLALMCTPAKAGSEWLESVLYSGMRGLQGTSSEHHRERMSKMALQPTPQVLQNFSAGWHLLPESNLWGQSNLRPFQVFVLSNAGRSDALALLRLFDVNRDHIVVICGPQEGTQVLSIASMGGNISGLLTSPSSRSPGVINDIDLRGSVLSLLRIQPEKISHRWSVIPADASSSELRLLRLITLCKTNGTLIWWVGIVAGIACILLIISYLAAHNTNPSVARVQTIAVTSLGMLPLASCELGRWIVDGYWKGGASGLLLLATCLAGGTAASVYTRYRAGLALRIVMQITVIYVVLTTIIGSECVSYSVISSYFLSGIRLYGIGNEYMGILVGSCLMMISSSGSKRMAVISLAVLALVFAVGPWGANLGGYATCVAAIVSMSLFGRTIRSRFIGYWQALVIGLITAVLLIPWPILVDSIMPVPTHMGEVAIRASLLGQNVIGTLFLGKLHMFLQVLMMPAGIASIIGFVVMLWYSLKKLRQHAAPAKSAQYVKWLQTGGFASIAAFLFNDSGIVPAVLIMACVMIFALLQQIEGDRTDHEQR